MTDVLIIADTVRSPELRHEVPLAVPDPFFYAEVGGKRTVVVSSLESGRIAELGIGLEVLTFEDAGIDDAAQAGARHATRSTASSTSAPASSSGLESATTPAGFPLGHADHLRANGIELAADQRFFDERRRVKNEHELAGIRRACRAVEAGIAVGVELLRSAVPLERRRSRSTASRSPASGSSSRSSGPSASTAQPRRSSSSRTAPRPRSVTTAAPARSPPTTSSSSTSSRATASRPATPTSRARSRSARRRTSSPSTTGWRRRRSTWRSPRSSPA